MKSLKIRFTRKPQYAPESLTALELTRIERLVKLAFGRTHKSGVIESGVSSYERGEGWDRLNFWKSSNLRNSTNPRGMIVARMTELVTREDAQRYFVACYNYLLAVGRNNGELAEYQVNSKKFAMASGYYG